MVPFLYLFFLLLFSSSASAACNQCVLAKAAFFASDKGLSAGACGYGALGLNLYGGHVAAALPSIYEGGRRCGACYQIRCKNPPLCSKTGTKMVVTDIHTDKSNTTDFVLSSRAFRAMALPGKDQQALKVGIMDVEYKRVPCVYKGQNISIRVENFSKYPNYLAVTVLYQGGQTDILTGDVAKMDSPNWKPLLRNFGSVRDTNEAPTGPLQFRFAIGSGFDAQYFYTGQVLPVNWKPGVIYKTNIQINNVALDGCTPCKPWK